MSLFPQDSRIVNTFSAPLQPVDPANVVYPAFATKAARRAWLREVLSVNPGWALWALGAIYARQTADERAAGVTAWDNGVGFTGVDAELLSSFAQQWQSRAWLSPKQFLWLHRKIVKYADQVAHILGGLGLATVVKVHKVKVVPACENVEHFEVNLADVAYQYDLQSA